MNKRIDIINPLAFLQAMEQMDAGTHHMAQLSSEHFRILEEKTKPLAGFTFRPGFPYCCGTHKKLLGMALDHFQKFPDCCEPHRRLLKARWFRKVDYAYFPIKLLLTCAYTEHCIGENLEQENWYKRITDYIEWTRDSFGQMPYGFGSPLGAGMYWETIKGFIRTAKGIPEDKRTRLLQFFEADNAACGQEAEIDVNVLIGLYKEWLSLFPFQISLFKSLKPYFENRLPLLKGPERTNMYTGLTGKKLITATELVDFLTATTKTILREVNALRLHQNGLLGDADALNMEIIVAKRELELKKYEHTSAESEAYQNILIDWFRAEKEFLNDITPVLKRTDEKRNFILDVIDGMKMLQSLDDNADCITKVRNDLPGKESAFRYAFFNFFKGRYHDAVISAEEEKGKRRIDLKITSPSLGEKIMEFKGWWNADKRNIAEQICSYLTDAHTEGYIFMINPNIKQSIEQPYQQIITSENMQCTSWESHRVPDTDFWFYISRHQFGIHSKAIYHFIFNVYFSHRKE